MKPIIGIVEWPYTDKDDDKIYEIFTPIVEWIIRSGGRPIGLFPTNIDNFTLKKFNELNDMSEIELRELKESIQMCDAIIKPGATKIYPHENKIYEYVYKENIPYLGICAGMQIMKNYNTPYEPNIKNNTKITHYAKDIDYLHNVNIVPDSKLYSILNKDTIMVNSRHNYHVASNGIHRIVAFSNDGIIEALENPDKLFNIGVQWHPELLPSNDENSINLFGEFVEAAKVYKKGR